MKTNELLNKIKKYHPETYEHCLRVGKLCQKMGEKNNFSKKKIKLLKTAGLLHDIGKLKIPKKILNKKGKLNDEEWKKMKEHISNGILKNFGEVKEIVEHHHKHQIKSYPHTNGISKDLCELSQIVAVCDMFDALKNKRGYKKEFSKEKVKKILGKEFTGDKKFVEQIFELENIKHN